MHIHIPAAAALPPRRVYTWTNMPPLTQNPLEQKLQWPTHTLNVLEQAQKLKLPRDCEWQINPEIAEIAPFKFAAEIYKRGVNGTPLPEANYQISFPKKLPIEQYQNYFWIVDAEVAKAWPNLPADYILNATETNKNLDQLANINSQLKHHPPNKPLLLVGGGLLLDLGAFCAKLCKRNFVMWPTSLIGMIDACVGGKNGVNTAYGKNLIGSWAHPSAITIWKPFLESLATNELQAAYGEVYKYIFLNPQLKPAPLNIEPFLKFKAQIVAADPSDCNLRQQLNLGHTLGHALEATTALKHGEAVAIGLLYILILSRQLNLLGSKDFQKMQEILMPILNFTWTPPDWEDLQPFLKQDKKRNSQGASWILLEGWGKLAKNPSGELSHHVNKTQLEKAWISLLKKLKL